MSNHDDDIFRHAMADVTPLPASPDRVVPQRRGGLTLSEKARRDAAQAAPKKDNNPLITPFDIPLCDPFDIGGNCKDGVQKRVYRKLRLGQYPVQDALDLHRLSIKDARDEVHQFLAQSHQQALRTLLITHGKGAKAVMKSHTWYWLEQHPLVLAWHSAPPRLGGAGATLVLIRMPRLSDNKLSPR